MKKFFVMVCAAFFVVSISASVYAVDTLDLKGPTTSGEADKPGFPIKVEDTTKTYGKTPFNKLTRGVFNVSTFFLEVPAATMRVSKEENNAFVGGTVGFAQGLFTGILRLGTGVFDTVTCVIPPYNKPLMEPEFAVQSIDQAQ